MGKVKEEVVAADVDRDDHRVRGLADHGDSKIHTLARELDLIDTQQPARLGRSHLQQAHDRGGASGEYAGVMAMTYEWRGNFNNAEVNALHAGAFTHRILDDNWKSQVQKHSLGWVCARDDELLVGFVNVAWDGGVHVFILDTMVTARVQRQGVGTKLVEVAVAEARAAGCEWLHVDFEDHLRSFYLEACGFAPTNAGLIAL